MKLTSFATNEEKSQKQYSLADMRTDSNNSQQAIDLQSVFRPKVQKRSRRKCGNKNTQNNQNAANRTQRSLKQTKLVISTQAAAQQPSHKAKQPIKLQREIRALRDQKRLLLTKKHQEMVTLYNSRGEPTRSFPCYSDRIVFIPMELEKCIHHPTVDFDVQSTDEQIRSSSNKLTRYLREATEKNSIREFTNDD